MNAGLFGMKPYEDTSKHQLKGLPRYNNSNVSKGLYSLHICGSNTIVFRLGARSSAGGMEISSWSSPLRMTIDYGDGTIIEQSTNLYVPTYTYPDGLSKPRTISVTIYEPLKLTRIYMVNQNDMVDKLCPIVFKNYPNLIYLNVGQCGWESFDDSFRTLKLSYFMMGTQTAYYRNIPIDMIKDMPLTQLSINQSQLGYVDFSTSKLDQVAIYFPNLQQFGLYANGINDNTGGVGVGLPNNFELFTNLTFLTLENNLYTKIPDVVGRISGLQTLIMSQNYGNPQTLTDISLIWTTPMTSLVQLGIDACRVLPVEIPAEMSALVKLKTINRGALNDLTKVNSFVDSMYDFVTNPLKGNSPITGTSSDRFRSMSIGIGNGGGPYDTPCPTGIYQQPSGYVQGVSNGNPVSQMEKIWVLEKQYGHGWNWSVKPVSVASITRSGSVVTVITNVPHNFKNSFGVVISGADQQDYNGTKSITVVDIYTFRFNVTTTPDTPATGTITVKFNA